jgi:hypothetical protein
LAWIRAFHKFEMLDIFRRFISPRQLKCQRWTTTSSFISSAAQRCSVSTSKIEGKCGVIVNGEGRLLEDLLLLCRVESESIGVD